MEKVQILLCMANMQKGYFIIWQFFPQNLFEYAQKCGDFRRENMQKGYFIIWQLCEKEITVITQCPSFKFLILRTLWNMQKGYFIIWQFFPQNLFEYAQKCGDFRRENMQKGYFIIWQLCEKEITVITQCPSFKFLILRTLWNGKSSDPSLHGS